LLEKERADQGLPPRPPRMMSQPERRKRKPSADSQAKASFADAVARGKAPADAPTEPQRVVAATPGHTEKDKEEARQAAVINVAKAALQSKKGTGQEPDKPANPPGTDKPTPKPPAKAAPAGRSQSAGTPGKAGEKIARFDRLKADRPLTVLGNRDLYPGFIMVSSVRDIMNALLKALSWPKEAQPWPKNLPVVSKDTARLITVALYRDAWDKFDDNRYNFCLKDIATLVRNRAWLHCRRKEGLAVFDETQERVHVHAIQCHVTTQDTEHLPKAYRKNAKAAGERVQEVYQEELPYVAERMLKHEGFHWDPRHLGVYARLERTKGAPRKNLIFWDPAGDNQVYMLPSPWTVSDQQLYCLQAGEILQRWEMADNEVQIRITQGWSNKT
jgi:hypothetical protein